MPEALLCPQCGKAVPSYAPQGLCPACMIQLGIVSEHSEQRTMPPVAPSASESATLPPRTPARAGEETCAAPDTGFVTEPESSAASPTPASVPGYDILAELGRGGMGVVYKARQTKLNRVVALKMILAGGHAGAADLARFRTEAEAIARLQHPNIVQVFEVGEHDGKPFFSLEYCGGGSLAEKLNGTPLPPKEAANVVEVLARAMDVAHRQGVIHRDLKPANVLLQKSFTAENAESAEKDNAATPSALSAFSEAYWISKITDFGLAKKLDDVGQTQSGAIMGTPSYMAPEQAGGKTKELGPAADIYALGAILYELLTGRPPFKAATPLDTVLQVVADDPVPPRQLQSTTPRDLETICLKCLAKEAHKRYVSALDLAEDLRRFQAGEPIKARPVGRLERGWRWCRRNPVVSGLVAAFALALVSGTVASALFALEAAAQADLAESRANDAKVKETEARQERRRSDRRAYIASIGLAQRSIQDGQLARARKLLEQLVPAAGAEEDLRHFEWHHLWHVCGKPSLDGSLISPDGTKLIRFSGKDYLILADAPSGKELARLTGLGPSSTVSCTRFSANAKRFMSGGRVRERVEGKEQVLVVWELSSGKTVLRMPYEAGSGCAALSPDGDQVALASSDGGQTEQLELFDVATGKSLGRLRDPDRPFGQPGGNWITLEFDPSARLLAGAHEKRDKEGRATAEVVLWDLKSRTVTRRFPAEQSMYAIAFSADGKWLVTGAGRTVKLWKIDGTLLRAFPDLPDMAQSVAISPDGKLVAAGSGGRGRAGEVRVWHVYTGQEVMAGVGHPQGVLQVVFAPGVPNRLYSAGADIRVWNIAPILPKVNMSAWQEWQCAAGLSFHPRDERVAVAMGNGYPMVGAAADAFHEPGWFFGKDDVEGRMRPEKPKPGVVRVLDLNTGKQLATLGAGDYQAVAYSPHGKLLAAAGGEEVHLFDADSGTRLWAVTPTSGERRLPRITVLQFSPDSSQLLIAGALSREGKGVTILDTKTGEALASLTTASPVARSCFLPEGRVAVLLTHKSRGPISLFVWDWAAKKVLWEQAIEWETLGLALSPDGRWLVSGGEKNVIQLWDPATGKRGPAWDAHAGPVVALAFSADGQRLFSAGSDRTLRVFDTSDGQELLKLDGGDWRMVIGIDDDGTYTVLHTLAASADGRRLISANGDDLRVWEAQKRATK